MADKIERTYIINLRREFSKVVNYRKSAKSIRGIKEFISRHMKSDNVLIGKHLNEHVWKNGRKNPPSKVEVRATKSDNKVLVELASAPIVEETPKKEDKKKETKTKVPAKQIEKELELDEKKQGVDPESHKKENKQIAKKEATKVPTASELKAKKKTTAKKTKN